MSRKSQRNAPQRAARIRLSSLALGSITFGMTGLLQAAGRPARQASSQHAGTRLTDSCNQRRG